MAKKQQVNNSAANNNVVNNQKENIMNKVTKEQFEQFSTQEKSEYIAIHGLMFIVSPVLGVVSGVVSVAANVVSTVGQEVLSMSNVDKIGTVVDRIKVGSAQALNTIQKERVKYLLETDELRERLNAENENLSTAIKALREKRQTKKSVSMFSLFTK